MERRRAARVIARLPVRLRLQDGREEVTRTEDLPKTGACFTSAMPMKEGERILLTVGYAPGSKAAEIPARIVWKRPVEGTTKALYGVSLEEDPKGGR